MVGREAKRGWTLMSVIVGSRCIEKRHLLLSAFNVPLGLGRYKLVPTFWTSARYIRKGNNQLGLIQWLQMQQEHCSKGAGNSI